MKRRLFAERRRRNVIRTVGLCLIGAWLVVDAQSMFEPGATPSVAISSAPIYPAQYNGDVRALPPLLAPRSYRLLNDFEGPPDRKPPFAPGPEGNQPESYAPLAAMPAPLINFSGLSYNTQLNGAFVSRGIPPDTNGDVGMGYYVQSVNDAFGIFDKTTGALVAGFTEDQLWSGAGTGTRCDADNRGDPVVLYDAVARRWILTNFAFIYDDYGDVIGPFYQCIAVSKTSDPVAGGYWLYAVRMDTGAIGAPPVGTLNDYGKFGIWTDCLYMGANGFKSGYYYPPYVGAIFAAFDRSVLYSGGPLTGSNSSIGFLASTTDFYTMIPANLLGPDADSLPPAGTPEYFVVESDSDYKFEVRKFIRGATACGAGSSLGALTNVSQAGFAFPQTVPQPGTSNQLDSLGDRIMNKVQYRRIGSAESLWVVHTTATATAIAQPQWAQIDVTGGTVSATPVQQQIYAPDAVLHRWIPSIATDRFGNVAIGYSTSSSAAFPGIAYSGRLAGDPLNQLSQSETVLVSGGGSQTSDCNGPCQRWGDYSSMSVDPEDDCTFWYTSEYYDTQASGNSGDWHTRVGAFKFAGCTARSTQTILFTSIASVGATFGDSPRVVTATASSGLAVKLTVDPASTSVCALSGSGTGSKVSYLGPGTCTIDANQFGDSTYRAAPQVQQTFSVAAIFRNGFEAL